MGWHIHFLKAFDCLSLNMYDNYKQNWWGFELYSEFFWVNIRQLKAWRNWQYISTKSVKIYINEVYKRPFDLYTPQTTIPLLCIYTRFGVKHCYLQSIVYIHVSFTPLVYPTVNWPKFWVHADKMKSHIETKTC